MSLWLTIKSWFKRKHKPKTYADFVHITSSGAVRVDIMGWWKTPEGRKEFDKLVKSFREFESDCRKNDPEGKFIFYD